MDGVAGFGRKWFCPGGGAAVEADVGQGRNQPNPLPEICQEMVGSYRERLGGDGQEAYFKQGAAVFVLAEIAEVDGQGITAVCQVVGQGKVEAFHNHFIRFPEGADEVAVGGEVVADAADVEVGDVVVGRSCRGSQG